ncbi:MAG: hypothetical protein WBY94_21835, partial [Polyangiaceae bacterium]
MLLLKTATPTKAVALKPVDFRRRDESPTGTPPVAERAAIGTTGEGEARRIAKRPDKVADL